MITEQMVDIGCVAFHDIRSSKLSSNITCAEINKFGNFDSFILAKSKTIKKDDMAIINCIFKHAKDRIGAKNIRKQELGFDIKQQNRRVHDYDIIMQDFAPLFIPKSLTENLIKVERTPSTIFFIQ